MKQFLMCLGELIRLGDTRSLELVIGLIAIARGAQFLGGLLDLVPDSTIVQGVPLFVVFLMSLVMVVGGVIKITGAVLNREILRIVSAMGLSGCWAYLALANLFTTNIFTLMLFGIMALQSSWVYIRLSLLRKQHQNHVS